MRLDRIAIALRVRQPWEAVDLGAVMLRAWWRPIYAAWFAIVLPIVLAVHVLFAASPWLALLVAWWLKPLYDRIVLHVLSQAVFGAPPDVRTTLASLGALIRSSGLLGALTSRRLDPARAFNLPVRQLEGQAGAAARSRERLLGRRAAGQATGLLCACIAFEFVLVVSLEMGIGLLTPAGMSSGDSDATLLATIFGGGQDDPSAHLRNLFYFLAVCAVEPLYVASGFALYLNRRTALEAWDIELGFRRIPRATGATVRNLVAMLAAAVLLCTLGASPTPAWAGESKDAARTVIREVLAGPEFQEFREKRVWRARDAAPGQREPGSRALSAELLMRIAEALSQLSRIAAYVIIGAATLALALYLLRSLRNGSASERTRLHERHAPPQTLFGLDVRPESLPADLANVAARLAAQDPRSALSLLYRGALATLMHRDGLAIGNGDTEGDCLRRVHTTHRAELAAYFARLVGAWSQTAYAGRAPDAASVAGLCTDWSRHFAAASGSNAR